jgi:hypothetical protein
VNPALLTLTFDANGGAAPSPTSRRTAVGIAAGQRRGLSGAVAVLQPALERGEVPSRGADEQFVRTSRS